MTFLRTVITAGVTGVAIAGLASCGMSKPDPLPRSAHVNARMPGQRPLDTHRETGSVRAAVATAPHSKSAPYVWRNVAIVGGGFVPGIIFNKTKPDLLYARTDMGGAYRWDTAGKRWIPLTDWLSAADWNLLGIESIATDPVEPNRVYLAAGTYINDWAGNGAILRSADQGKTFQRSDLPFKLGGNWDGRSMGERLMIDPNKNNILYLGTRKDGLWRSEDFGATWAKVDSFPVKSTGNGIGVVFVTFDPHSGSKGQTSQTIYVGVADTAASLYRSQDGGKSWELLPGQPKGLMPHHGVLDSNGVLYLSYSNRPGPNGASDGAVWKFATGSGEWTDITPVKPGGFGYAGLAVDAQRPGTVMVATLDRWSTGDGIYRTTDGGATWRPIAKTAVRDSSAAPYLNWGKKEADMGHWIGTLEIDPFHPGHVLYGTGATIWGSDNADALDAGQPTQWTVRAAGIEEISALELISPPSGAHLISVMGDIGGFRHDDFTVSPRAGNFSNPRFNTATGIDFAEQVPSFIVRCGNGSEGHGGYSTDGAATWSPFAKEPEGQHQGGSIAVSADAGTIIWTPGGGAANHSEDRGATWAECQGVPGNARVIADRMDAKAFYAYDGRSGSVFVSKDGGATFSAAATGLPQDGGNLKAVPGHSGDLWLTLHAKGLWHSTDGGATFAQVGTVAECNAIAFGKTAPGRSYPAVYIFGKSGDVTGVLRSDDMAKTWVRINDDAHQFGTNGQALAADPRVYGRVYLGTNGRGILYADPK